MAILYNMHGIEQKNTYFVAMSDPIIPHFLRETQLFECYNLIFLQHLDRLTD